MTKAQMQVLTLAYDLGADVKQIASAIELARTQQIELVVSRTALQMSLRAAVKDNQ